MCGVESRGYGTKDVVREPRRRQPEEVWDPLHERVKRGDRVASEK